ncbi:hypothetical protein J6590_040350 [Homalodisca vitripennis]|nr:hypothetical protein J6590_040350 [Homalodisca vitripennis]
MGRTGLWNDPTHPDQITEMNRLITDHSDHSDVTHSVCSIIFFHVFYLIIKNYEQQPKNVRLAGDSQLTGRDAMAEQDAMHHIVTIQRGAATLEKPPDYDSVTGAAPPSYEDAIKLSPAHLVLDSSVVGDTVKVDGEGQSQSGTSNVVVAAESQSTSVVCQVHSKPDSGSSDESSDNFGTRVLRISRKFLRRPKSGQDVEDPRTPQEQDGNVAPDVSVR